MKDMTTFSALVLLASAGGLAAWALKDKIKAQRKPDPVKTPEAKSATAAAEVPGDSALLRQGLGLVLQQDPWILEGFLVEYLAALDAGLVARALVGVQRDPHRSPVLTRLVVARLVQDGHPMAEEASKLLTVLNP